MNATGTMLIDLVLLFFIYSLTGWCIEVCLKYIQYLRFINRGFLTGPICPIYGTGAVLITVAVHLLTPFEEAFGTTFVISFLLCGGVEYFTSWYLEKRFHARWWDYSQKPMNLHGRVWIGNLILFGLGGVAIVHFFNPVLFTILDRIALLTKEIAVGVLAAVCASDYAMTHFILKLVKTSVECSQADNTEEISLEIRRTLTDKSVFYRRFAEAYPDVIYRTDRIKARLAEIKAETEMLKKEAEQRAQDLTKKVGQIAEPTALVKASLIERQGNLIALLYDEKTANEEVKALKATIDADLERLENRPITKIENIIRK